MNYFNEIKIFIASSEELKHERQVFSDIALKLNLLLKENNIRINLEKWEYLDSSMGIKKKQDDYNEILVKCDICIALFWNIFGDFTSEEFKLAQKEAKKNQTLKYVYLYFKSKDKHIKIDDIKQKEHTEKLEIFKKKCRESNVIFYDFIDDKELICLFINHIDKYCKKHFGLNIAEVKENKLMVKHISFADMCEISKNIFK